MLYFVAMTISQDNFKGLIDTAIEEQFRSAIKFYYENDSLALVVYNITNEDSLNSIRDWVRECQNFGNKNNHIVLVGNKTYLQNKRKVSIKNGRNLAGKFQMDFFEASAKIGDNTENIFNRIWKYLNDNMDEGIYAFFDKNSWKEWGNLDINKTLENAEKKNVVHHVFNHYLFYYKKQ